MIPLYGFLQGDTIGLLVLAQPTDTALELAAKLASAASVRVAPFPDPRVVYEGKELRSSATVGETRMKALARFDVVRGTKEAP